MLSAAGATSPLLAHLRPWLDRSRPGPDGAILTALAGQAGILTESGHALRFALPEADGLGYEERIWRTGAVETRPDNWHDFFNALIWLAFPSAKAALNARHMREMRPVGEGRGEARDAMTQFDECGLVVVADDPSLLELLRHFRWKDLFWARRGDLAEHLRFYVFGHGTCEQLLAPFRGLTAKAVLYEVSPAWLAMPLADQLADLDGRLAAAIAAGGLASPRELQPVPLLGIPGVTPASEDAAYYDDTWQFRPGRRADRALSQFA